MVAVLHCHLGVAATDTAPTTAPTTTPSSLDMGVTDWIHNAEGGFFSPKQELRKTDNSTQSAIGVFAVEDIAEGEVLMTVPWELIIKSPKKEEGQMCCGTVDAVWKEMKKGENSKYHPYPAYLKSQPDDDLPSNWNEKAKDLLYEIIGVPQGNDPRTSDFDSIPPEEPIEWLEIDYHQKCQGSRRDPMANHAALLVVQRSDDYIMVPGYDLYNHRNGKYHNTEIRWEDGQPHVTKASRAIQKGEQIYNSYNFCVECEGRRSHYGAAEILRDYGFVEEYPQRWYYSNLGGTIQFDIDEDEETGEVKIVDWQDRFLPKDEYLRYARVWVRRQLRRQRRIQNLNFHRSKWPTIPERQWQIIWDFHKGNTLAMELAREHLDKVYEKAKHGGPLQCSSPDDAACASNVTAALTYEEGHHHYDPLGYEPDDLDYISPTCDNGEVMMFHDYIHLESLQTNYQPVGFEYHEEMDDVCMDIDNIVQICSCYRPQYHEFVTHYAARFIDTVKRVLFVGGGDSMLLFEALKYPTLELVVGLELDQTITRKSFKYFQTQPHFDDDRVEWWFGDATKSMLLLPEEYWGSFDLVLVDLSETVMSLSVTKELDVFDALALLLNKDGVIVKNELYLEHFSDVFDYTVQILYDSPIICSQVVALGSNKVDFLHDAAKDHEIPNLLYTPLTEDDNRFDLMHDYRKNDARAIGKCDTITPPIDTSSQGSSAGILEIVNAENVSISLEDKAKIAKLLQDVASAQGFTIGPSKAYGGNLVVAVLKEGYIAARLWPEDNYIGFDINLWGKTYEIKSLKNALTKAVESSLVSAYKVVVGGMFGSSTWKEDQVKIGPYSKTVTNMNRNCQERETSPEVAPIPQSAIEIALNQTFTLLESSYDGVTVGVVCGVEGSDCMSFDVAEANPIVTKVFKFQTCNDLEGEEKMFQCEKDLAEEWMAYVNESNKPFDMLLMDSSAPIEMFQILNSILDADEVRESLLNALNVVLAFTAKPKEEKFRKWFLDRYRVQHGDDPVARAVFELHHAGEDIVEIGLVYCGNMLYVYSLEAVEHNIKERLTDVEVELNTINAGLFPYDYDFEPVNFEQRDYDNAPGLKQFAEQKPLGRQNIFQLGATNSQVELQFEGLFGMLKAAIQGAGFDSSVGKFEKTQKIGDGGLIVYSSKVANVVLVWDGRTHVDLNFFTFSEGKGEKVSGSVPDKFISGFLKASHRALQVNLRDDQPRGTGRVINFPSDLLAENAEATS
ncbi:MAG: hypothetical protein SGBAC_010183 [Bacillariaceae sp.]